MSTKPSEDEAPTIIGKTGALAMALGVYLDHTDDPSRIRGPAFIVAGALLFGLDWLWNGKDSKMAKWWKR